MKCETLLATPEEQNQKNVFDYLEQYAKLTHLTVQERKYTYPDGYNSSIAYRSYLDGLDQIALVPHAWKPLRCIKHGSEHRCSNPDCKTTVFKPEVCGIRKLCVICGHRYSREQTNRAMRYVNGVSELIDGLHVISIVFTLPEIIQDLLNHDNFGRFTNACKRTMYQYQGRCMPAGLMTSHTWHSKNPLSGWYPHVHSVWLNLVFNKKTNKFEPTNSYLDVAELRRIYREQILLEFGAEIPDECVPDDFNIRTEYATVDDEPFLDRRGHTVIDKENKHILTNREKVRHMLKYALRMPQEDITKYSNRRKLTEYSDQEKTNISATLLLPKNWRRSRWFGWLADGVVTKYLRLLGLNPNDFKPTKQEEDADPRVYCPICRSECKHVRSVTIEQLRERGVNFYYPYDPGGLPKHV